MGWHYIGTAPAGGSRIRLPDFFLDHDIGMNGAHE
jgi:hypothetical protein